MKVYEKIRAIRELNHLSQEDMADKLEMSTTGYAKIERGQTKLKLEKLEQIAQIFNIDVIELINTKDKNLICLINENSDNSSNYYSSDKDCLIEIEKLKTKIEYLNSLLEQKDMIILQKDNEIKSLHRIIELLDNKNNTLDN